MNRESENNIDDYDDDNDDDGNLLSPILFILGDPRYSLISSLQKMEFTPSLCVFDCW